MRCSFSPDEGKRQASGGAVPRQPAGLRERKKEETRQRLLIERPELRARGTQLLFSAHQVLADALRSGVPGLDAYGAVAAAGATIGGLVAVVLHALEHGGSVDEVRAALTATLNRL